MTPEVLSLAWYRSLSRHDLHQLADPDYPDNRIYDAAMNELGRRNAMIAAVALAGLGTGAIVAALAA